MDYCIYRHYAPRTGGNVYHSLPWSHQGILQRWDPFVCVAHDEDFRRACKFDLTPFGVLSGEKQIARELAEYQFALAVAAGAGGE